MIKDQCKYEDDAKIAMSKRLQLAWNAYFVKA
jgi:hypothetical protein